MLSKLKQQYEFDDINKVNITMIQSDNFNVHFFEALTGIKFVLVAARTAVKCDSKLRDLYEIYSDYISKDPFYMVFLHEWIVFYFDRWIKG